MEQVDLQEKQERWKNDMELPIIISGVLFVIDIAFLPNLVQTHKLTEWETCSLFFFAISLPLLATNALIMREMLTSKKILPGKNMWLLMFQLAGYLASIFGVTTSIINVCPLMGMVFLVLALYALGFSGQALRKLSPGAE